MLAQFLDYSFIRHKCGKVFHENFGGHYFNYIYDEAGEPLDYVVLTHCPQCGEPIQYKDCKLEPFEFDD